MANTDAPFGLKPLKMISGAPYNGSANEYSIAAGYGTNLFVGDPVVKTGTSSSAGIATIEKATAGDGNAITGVIVGFVGPPNRANLDQQYSVLSTAATALVCDDPNVIFIIQDDGGGTPAITSVGLNAVLIYTHTGSTVFGTSQAELDFGSSVAPSADASNQLTILRLHQQAGNTIGDNAIWEVKINNHTEGYGAIGI